MNVAICDDEAIIVQLLEELVVNILIKREQQFEVFTFTSGYALLKQANKIDLVFLDIDMPEIDGIALGKKIHNINSSCKVVMATSRVERFKESFKISAFRFVTKPFEVEEIEEAIEAFEKLQMGKGRIKMYLDRNEYEIEEKRIKYVSAYNSYTEFLVDNKLFRKETSLKEIERITDNRFFFRINKQYLINLFWISQYQNGNVQIANKNFKVSRRRKKEFEKFYTNFIFSYGEELCE